MNLYLDNGYLDMKKLKNHPAPFVFVVAARGTGKTYGALWDCMDKTKDCNLLLRRLDTQFKQIITERGNPFRTINNDHGTDYKLLKAKGGQIATLYDGMTDSTFGFASALTTFKNVRSIDFSNTDFMFYDEFIGEAHDLPIRGEGDAFLNIYESINRNRELNGRPPLKVICAANSNRLDNALFADLKLIDDYIKLQNSGEESVYIQSRGVLLVYPRHSPISEKKKETALYKFARGSNFEDMAIENQFSYDDQTGVGTRPLREYKPICIVDGMTILEHKSRSDLYIINTSYRDSQLPRFDTRFKDGLSSFKNQFGLWVWGSCVDGNVTYQTYSVKSKIFSIFH